MIDSYRNCIFGVTILTMLVAIAYMGFTLVQLNKNNKEAEANTQQIQELQNSYTIYYDGEEKKDFRVESFDLRYCDITYNHEKKEIYIKPTKKENFGGRTSFIPIFLH